VIDYYLIAGSKAKSGIQT